MFLPVVSKPSQAGENVSVVVTIGYPLCRQEIDQEGGVRGIDTPDRDDVAVVREWSEVKLVGLLVESVLPP